MRTTISIPDDVLDSARALTAHDGISLENAIAVLVRRGFMPEKSDANISGFPVFAVSQSAPPITLEQTLDAEDDILSPCLLGVNVFPQMQIPSGSG